MRNLFDMMVMPEVVEEKTKVRSYYMIQFTHFV